MPMRKNGEIYGRRPKHKTIHKYHFLFANEQVQLARHHLIPWTVVKHTWNYFIQKREYDILRIWARLVLERFHSLDWVDRHFIEPIRRCQFVDDIVLCRKLCWGAWNIVIGPRIRDDDPGPTFDHFTAPILPKEVRVHSFQLSRLHYHFVHAPRFLDHSRNRIIELLETIHAKRKFLRVDPTIWEPVLFKKRGVYGLSWRKKSR